jgi:peroxiredoxin
MVAVGDDAPDFTAPLAHGDVSMFTLSEHLHDAPIVLAFFPGAFTSTCRNEMSAFEDRLAELQDAGASIYGVSVDSPFALNEFRDKLGLSFGLLSDANRDLIHDYDVVTSFDHVGIEQLAKRAVFVVDGDGTVSYAWVSDDPGVEPDYDAVFDAIENA